MKISALVFGLLLFRSSFAQTNCVLNFAGHQIVQNNVKVEHVFNGLEVVGCDHRDMDMSFKGVMHIERGFAQVEDPLNPGTYFTITNDSLTTIYIATNVIDSIRISELKELPLYCLLGKDTMPVCEMKIKSDSSENTIEINDWMEAYKDKAEFQLYGSLYSYSTLMEQIEKTSSDKFFVYDIYCWDWKEGRKVQLEYSIYLTR